jgi:hypothetical protein
VMFSPISSSAWTIKDGSNGNELDPVSHRIPSSFCWLSKEGDRGPTAWFSSPFSKCWRSSSLFVTCSSSCWVVLRETDCLFRRFLS